MPRGGNQPLSTFIEELDLPRDFTSRPTSASASSNAGSAAIEWMNSRRPARQNYWPALTLALIAQCEKVLAELGEQALEDALEDERVIVETEGSGRTVVNTLNVRVESTGFVARLRPLYNKALSVIRTEMRREHPSNPGHATQSWRQYHDLIDLLYSMPPSDRTLLAQWIWKHGVVAKPELTQAQHRDRRVRPFYELVSGLDTASSLGGAIFQALVYAYIKADSPTLHVESNAVNTGSSRAGAIGDVDAFDGEFIVLAVEAKDKDLTLNDEDDLAAFIEDTAAYPDVDAVVIARSFDAALMERLEQVNIRPMSRSDMAAVVALWDPLKQIVAVKAMKYYLARIQRRSHLVDVVDDALRAIGAHEPGA